jgi:hypothetical protein
MSIYQRLGQGPFTPSKKKITAANVDQYYTMAANMDAEIKWVDSYVSLVEKLKPGAEVVEGAEGAKEAAYSPEYVQARLAKLKTDPIAGSKNADLIDVKTRLKEVVSSMKAQLPIVMDKTLGSDVAEHQKMSDMDDERKRLEDALVEGYRKRYPLLHEVLPKVFYLLVDGCDMATVQSCFTQLKKVLTGEITSQNATSTLMNESTERYNLPKGFWDVKKEK